MIQRKKTKKIRVGSVSVGGGAPVTVQSMTNTDTRNARATLAQIRRLEKAGCEIVRIAVPDDAAAEALKKIVPKVRIPVIADIHFKYRLALQSIDAGVDGIRINPGNIGSRDRVAAVIDKARAHKTAIRIGINSGSLEKDILKQHGHPSAAALAQSALRHIELIEGMGFESIKVSLKSTNVRTTIDAYRIVSEKTRFPLHIGVTEAGTAFSGTIKSSVGLGILLHAGIGDTLRVSLSADPVEEVRAGQEILKCLGLRTFGPDIISCPTCGRRQIDVIRLARQVEKKLIGFPLPLKVAVMGCEVNGPGEAREADIGVAGGSGAGVIFRYGKVIKRCPQETLFEEFLAEIYAMLDEKSQ